MSRDRIEEISPSVNWDIFFEVLILLDLLVQKYKFLRSSMQGMGLPGAGLDADEVDTSGARMLRLYQAFIKALVRLD